MWLLCLQNDSVCIWPLAINHFIFWLCDKKKEQTCHEKNKYTYKNQYRHLAAQQFAGCQ